MEIYPILNKPGKGKYVFIFILNERAVEKRKKITLKDYYEALPKPVVTSEKQRFLDRIAERCKVSDTTVRNWCMYGFRPQKQEHINILAEETGIPAADLFAYTH